MSFEDAAGAAGTINARKAALLLHALAPDDRDWLLAQLPEEQQEELTGLVADLVQMGIAPDPWWMDRVTAVEPAPAAPLQAAPTRAPLPAPAGDEAALFALAPAQVQSLARAFRREPASLVAACLRLSPWPWKTSLLEQLPTTQRLQVQSMLEWPEGLAGDGTLARRALLRQLRAASEQPVPEDARPVPPAPAPRSDGRFHWFRRIGDAVQRRRP